MLPTSSNLRKGMLAKMETLMNTKFREAILQEMTKSDVLVGDDVESGMSISHLMFCLRDKGWRRVTEYNITECGFRIVSGKTGMWTKDGFRHVRPARVVVIK